MSAGDQHVEVGEADVSTGESTERPAKASARTPRAALRLTLTDPETVPMTGEQHQQAVAALSAMISAWLRRRARHPALGDRTNFDL